MGFKRTGPLGDNCSPQGLQNPIHLQSPTHCTASFIHKLPDTVSSICGTRGGCASHDSEGCHRGGSSNPRILQQDVCCDQIHRGLEAHHRPQPSEQDGNHHKVQDGDSLHGSFCHQTTGVANINRSEGCILPHSNPPSVSSIPEVCVGGQDLPIQSSLLWALHSSTGIHQGDGSSGSLGPSTRIPASPLPGRLAPGSNISSTTHQSSRLDLVPGPRIGPNSQLGEVRPDSYPIIDLSGHADQHSSGPGPSCQSSSGEIFGVGDAIQKPGISSSMGMAATFGPYGLPREIGSQLEDPSQIFPVPTQVPMVPTLRQQTGSDSSNSRECLRSDMVGGSTKSACWHSSFQASTRFTPLHGCLHPRVGSSLGGLTSLRPVVRPTVQTTYQPIRTQGCLAGTTEFPGVCSEQTCHSHVRQLHSGILHKEPGRNQVLEFVSGDFSSPSMVSQFQYTSHLSVPGRQAQCQSRPIEPQKSSTSCRMVSSSCHMSQDLEVVGDTSGGPVCHSSESQTTSVLLSHSRSSGLGSGCHVSSLGQPDSLCLSSSLFDKTSTKQADTVSEPHSDPGGTSVASTGVVRGTATSSHRPSQEPASMEKITKAASSRQISSKSKLSISSRLEVIESAIRKKGFSRQAASRMARPQRTSTTNLYQAKWSQFCNWCRERKKNPLHASVPLIADFFIFLREEKGCSSSTIKGYRSALAQVFIQRGVDISSSPEISALMKNFDQELTKQSNLLPKWDLNLVLSSLLSPPYEPLASASLKDLTLKTVFLLALASSKRVSELHGLSYVVSHSRKWKSVTLSYLPDFIAKTQVPGKSTDLYTSFSIPALRQIVGPEDQDILLCPVRSLKEYLKRTSDSRPKHPRLFISSQRKRKDISKNTVSYWIRSVIKRAYNSASEEDKKLWKISTHEVRALSTSLLFRHNCAILDVMSAASWRNNTTFASFYLRDLSHKFLDLSSLGPIVAGQTLLPKT